MKDKKKMTVREFAKSKGFTVVGKLRRMPDKYYGMDNRHYPWYMDEANNEYLMDDDGVSCGCIVTADGGVI